MVHLVHVHPPSHIYFPAKGLQWHTWSPGQSGYLRCTERCCTVSCVVLALPPQYFCACSVSYTFLCPLTSMQDDMFTADKGVV